MTGDPIVGVAPRRAVHLWLALLAGPAAASLQLSVNYALVKWACGHGGAWMLGSLAAIFLLLSVAGAALGAAHLARARDQHGVQLWSVESLRLLAITAVGLDTLIVVFLLNSLIAVKVISPCE